MITLVTMYFLVAVNIDSNKYAHFWEIVQFRISVTDSSLNIRQFEITIHMYECISCQDTDGKFEYMMIIIVVLLINLQNLNDDNIKVINADD